MKHILKMNFPLLLLSICLLGVLTGCKVRASTVAQPTATTTAVRITMQNTEFNVSEPLGILVKNTGSADVYAVDGLASCTMLQLEQYDADKKGWVVVDRCRETVQPRVLVLRAGMSEPFTLAPNSPGDPNAWAPGLYRIALTFTTHTDGRTETLTAYSQGFTIQGS